MAVNRLSRILGPLKSSDPRLVNVKNILSRSTKLFSDEGLVRLYDGKAALLPFMVRAMRKLERIIHEEMEKVSAYEILLPALVSENLLKATGRDGKDELFKLVDRTKRNYVLAPTGEEAITHLIGVESNLKESSFPLRFYQISSKFRDEAHPKHGLIRAKEFIMKDLYCFDKSSEMRASTYMEVTKQYDNLFRRLGMPFICASSSGSDMFGTESHEYHFLSEIGEDEIVLCQNCGHNVNTNLVQNKEKCHKCSSSDVKIVNGIEVGHAFNIGTTYSEKLNAVVHTNTGESKFLEMSSYGIGVTRILGAAAEVLSTDSKLRWPAPLVPYTVCIIPPKAGSKEESQLEGAVNDMYTKLNQNLSGDVVIDDRSKYTIGKRLVLDQKLGFPFIVVVGNEMLKDSPRVEVFDVNEDEKHLLHPSDAVSLIVGKMSGSPH